MSEAQVTVWAFQPLPELNHEVGFVSCGEKLARELLAAGKVDDPAGGSLHMREIQFGSAPQASSSAPPPADERSQEYETTQMTPARSSPKKRGSK